MRWLKSQKRSMRQLHAAGEKLFMDFCGSAVPVINPDTGEVKDAVKLIEQAVTVLASRKPVRHSGCQKEGFNAGCKGTWYRHIQSYDCHLGNS